MEDWQMKRHRRELRMRDRDRKEKTVLMVWTLVLVGLLFMVPLVLDVFR